MDLSNEFISLQTANASHDELLKVSYKILGELVRLDSAFAGISPECDIDELNSVLALVQGQAIMVLVERCDGQIVPVIVDKRGTVGALKAAIKVHFNRLLRRENNKSNPSWKHFWRNHTLECSGQYLNDDSHKLTLYNVNNSKILFVKKQRMKQFQRS